MTKLIPLSAGKCATVDDEDYEWLMRWKWSFDGKYAMRNDQGHSISMHREIMRPPPGIEVDHIDRDRLNNCRSNLRTCTRAQNSRNVPGRAGTSQYKGVVFSKVANRWEAGISINNTRKSLGYYDNERDAALAYDKAARREYGEFALLNFPDIHAYEQIQHRRDNPERTREMRQLLAQGIHPREVAEKLGMKTKYVREVRNKIRAGKIEVS